MNGIATADYSEIQTTPQVYDFRLEVPSSTEFVGPIMSFFYTLLKNKGAEEMVISNTVTAIIEAVANAMTHGNQLDETKKTTILVTLGQTSLRVEIADEGYGFDLRTIPDPLASENLMKLSGRGIFLIRTLMDKVAFDFTGKGTCIIMEKEFL